MAKKITSDYVRRLSEKVTVRDLQEVHKIFRVYPEIANKTGDKIFDNLQFLATVYLAGESRSKRNSPISTPYHGN